MGILIFGCLDIGDDLFDIDLDRNVANIIR
jgi:hypothetical protein